MKHTSISIIVTLLFLPVDKYSSMNWTFTNILIRFSPIVLTSTVMAQLNLQEVFVGSYPAVVNNNCQLGAVYMVVDSWVGIG